MTAVMSTIGLIGGMSWESSALYYRLINQAAQRMLGGHHNAISVLYTLDFEPLVQAGNAGRWDDVSASLADAGRRLRAAGADFFLLTANTAHLFAEDIERDCGLPLLHIGTATAAAIRQAGLQRVGLIGTRHVTGSNFYIDWFRDHHGIEVVPPPAADRALLDRIVMEELTCGRVDAISRAHVLAVIDRMRLAGLEGVIVGCTELPLLLADPGHPASIACYDTTRLHAEMAVSQALASRDPGTEVFHRI